MTPLVALLVASLLMLVNGAAVVAEGAVLSARRARLEEWQVSGRVGAERALRLLDDGDRTLAVSQLVVSTVAILLGWFAVPALAEPVSSLLSELGTGTGAARVIAVAAAFAAVVALLSVLGELLPRWAAAAAPERILCSAGSVVAGVVAVIGPVAAVPIAAARGMTRFLGLVRSRAPGSWRPGGEARTSAQLAELLGESWAGGQLAEAEHELALGALSLRERTVRDVMARRADLVTVPHTVTVAEAEALVHRSGHSRVLVLGDGPDEVVGFLHVKDLIALGPEHRDQFLPPGIVRVALRVRPDEPLDSVLVRMRRARRHVAVVLESGTVAGLVTLEDLLESLVGEIRDETDRGRDHDGRP